MNTEIIKKLYKSKLVKSGIWYTVGGFFLQGLSIITLPLYTRLLSDVDYGISSVYTTWFGVFLYLVPLSLVSCVNNAKIDYKEEYEEFTSSIFFLATILLGIWLVVGLIFKNQIGGLIDLNPHLTIVLIIQCFFQFIIDFSNAKLNSEYKYKSFLFIAVSNAILNIILSIFMIQALDTNKYYGRIFSGVIVSVIYGVVLYILAMKKGKKLICTKYWKYALAISLPTIIHSISGVILHSIDTVMINSRLGAGEAGIYSFSYRIGMIINIVWLSCNRAWVPWSFEKMKEEKYKELGEKVKYYIAFFSIVTVMIIFVSPEIGAILGKGAFLNGLKYVPVIMLGYYFVFLYSIPVNVEFYTKKTQYVALGTVLSAVINIGLNSIFIVRFGAMAAAWVTLISYIFLFIYHYIMAKYLFENKIYELKHFVYGVLFVGLSGVLFYMIRSYWMMRYAFIIIVVGFILYIFKKKNLLIS